MVHIIISLASQYLQYSLSAGKIMIFFAVCVGTRHCGSPNVARGFSIPPTACKFPTRGGKGITAANTLTHFQGCELWVESNILCKCCGPSGVYR